MKESIFLLNNDCKLIEMNESGYITEDHLQELLANYPDLISGSQINPDRPRRWLLISREFGVPDELNANDRWSLDNLFIDQDGIPTLVEVKRSTDTRIRREVIGQVLDYAANAVSYWSVEEIKYRFEERCKELNQDPEAELISFLRGSFDTERFWENTKINLKAGKIRMLIIADTIPKEMQRIIEFLNGQMTPAEILGIEIKQFVNNDLKTLVPRVLGLTSVAEITKGKGGVREKANWDNASFMEEIFNRNGQSAVEAVNQLINWANNKAAVLSYGTGTRSGSLQVWFKARDNKFISCFIIYTYGVVEMQFQHMKTSPFNDEAKRKELFDKINAIPGVNISLDKINKRPQIKFAILYDKDNLEQFLSVFDWYFDEIKPHL